MSKIHHKADDTGRGWDCENGEWAGDVRMRKKGRFPGWEGEAGGTGKGGPRGGKQMETSREKENQGTLVRWSSNPPHRIEEMENTIKKKNRTGVLEMDGRVTGNEHGKEPERKNV